MTIPASIEIQPKQALSTEDIGELFPKGCRLYLVDVGVESLDSFVAAARRLVDLGFVPVPHIPARRLTTRGELEQRIARLSELGGVTDILVIGGGLDKPVGEFTSSMDVLATGVLDRFGILDVGIAGHPEGSPDFSEAVAQEVLRLKQEFAQRTDASMRIVTQFGFAPEKFIRWADGLNAAGVELPVHLGVAGPAKLPTLIKYAIACGVGQSLNLLKKKASLLTSLTSGHSPEDVVAPIEQHYLSNSSTPITQIHVFPFGGIRQASAWLKERGSWDATARIASQA
jgi:methylenetetrahydrofolate reductase (NADPH)